MEGCGSAATKWSDLIPAQDGFACQVLRGQRRRCSTISQPAARRQLRRSIKVARPCRIQKHTALSCALHHHELSGAVVWVPTQRSHSEPCGRESSQCLKKKEARLSKLPLTTESRLQIIKRYRASWIHRPHCTDKMKYPREVRGNSCDATACQSSVMSQFTS